MKNKFNTDEKHKKTVEEYSKAYKKNIGKIATQRIKLISLLRKDLEYRTKIKKLLLFQLSSCLLYVRLDVPPGVGHYVLGVWRGLFVIFECLRALKTQLPNLLSVLCLAC